MFLLIGLGAVTVLYTTRIWSRVKELDEPYYSQEDVDWNMFPIWITAFAPFGGLVHVDLIPYLRFGKNVTITSSVGPVWYLDPSSYATSGQKANLTWYNERGDVHYAIFSLSDVYLTSYNSQGNVTYNNPTFFRGWIAYGSNDNIYVVGPSDGELTTYTSNGIKEVVDFDTKTATVYDPYGNKYHIEQSGKNLTVYNPHGDIIAQLLNPFLMSDKNMVIDALDIFMNPSWLSTYSYRHSFPFVPEASRNTSRQMTRRDIDLECPQVKGNMMGHGPVVMTNKTTA